MQSKWKRLQRRLSQFHIALVDGVMGGISGLEVCKQLRQRYSAIELPIIMVSTRTAAEDAEQAINLGCNDYVRKPFTRVELIARVHMQLSIVKERIAFQERIQQLEQAKVPSRALAVPSRGSSALVQRSNIGPCTAAMVPLRAGEEELGSIDVSVARSVLQKRSDALHGEIAELRSALRDREREARLSRAKLAEAQAKQASAEAEAEEVWQRLAQSEHAFLELRHGSIQLDDSRLSSG